MQTYETVAHFAAAGAPSTSSRCSSASLVYALWPATRADFDDAARIAAARRTDDGRRRTKSTTVTGTATTGHEWDGIKELNTPLPRWWLWTFYAMHRLGGRLLGRLSGLAAGHRLHPRRARLFQPRRRSRPNSPTCRRCAAPRARAAASRPRWPTSRPIRSCWRFASARARPRSATIARRATARARRAPGYPNLNDDDWLWGGTLDEIQHTITHGIRSGRSRHAHIADAGLRHDGMLKPAQIDDGRRTTCARSPAAGRRRRRPRGRADLRRQCAACHGDDGKGNTSSARPT